MRAGSGSCVHPMEMLLLTILDQKIHLSGADISFYYRSERTILQFPKVNLNFQFPKVLFKREFQNSKSVNQKLLPNNVGFGRSAT